MTAVLWQASDGGSEVCVLERSQGGWRVEGTVLTHDAGEPFEIRYAVVVDAGWRTTGVSVRIAAGSGEARELHELGALWSARPRPVPYQHCVDVDLGFTPATNTLPIRRLDLAVGDHAEIEAVWLTWPELDVQPARQRYARLAEHRYRYTQGDFTAELEVDDEGLVVDYEGLWRAVARM